MNFKLTIPLLLAFALLACHKTEQPKPIPPADPLLGKWEEVNVIGGGIFAFSRLVLAEFTEEGNFRYHIHNWTDAPTLCGDWEEENYVLGKYFRDSTHIKLHGDFVDSTFSFAHQTCDGLDVFKFKLAYRLSRDTLFFPNFTMENGNWEPARKLYRLK